MKAALLGAVAVAADPIQQAFYQFIKDHKKQYPVEEFFDRFNIFKANFEMIEAHNNGSAGWKMGINQFADLTREEFKSYLGLRPRDNSYLRSKNEAVVPNVPVNDIDWTTKGAVTPVKDQAQCGSCWAFSTTGSVEGVWAITTGNLVSLSEQELVDCAGSAGNQGCNGGLMDDAFNWIIQNGGLDTEADYPYHAQDGSCRGGQKAVSISGFKDVPQGNEGALGSLLQAQPISVAIEADQSSFQYYHSGVFTGPCGQQLDHGVLLVGMGTDNGQDYWRIKNSWGSSWGDQGYIRILRGEDLCGIANMASFPTR